MSGFIGYDVERLTWLRDAMRRADDELVRTETADPAATGPMRRLRRIRSIFDDVWLPMLEGAIATDTRTRATSTTLADLDPWNPFGPGFTAASSREPGATADQLERALARVPARLVTEAIELADLLADSDLTTLLAPDAELDRLSGRFFEIAAHASAAGAFRATFDDWEELMATLAVERLEAQAALDDDPHDRGAADRLARYDELLAAVGAVLSSGSGAGHRPAAPPVLARLDPYSAALLLPYVALDGELLADVATQLLRRWHDGPEGHDHWIDFAITGDSAVDIIFRELATDPTAATRFLETAVDRPDTVVLGAHDPANFSRLLRVGTDPHRLDPGRAGAIIIPLIDWLRDDWSSIHALPPGTTMMSRAELADVLAPWVLYLGPRATQWGWSYEDGDDAFRWVIEDEAALDFFLDGLVSEQGSLGDLPFADADGRIADLLVREQTMMFAQLESAIVDVQHEDAVDDKLRVDLIFSSVKFLAGRILMPTAVGPTALVRDATVTAGVNLARRTLERQHILPATPDEVDDRTHRDRDERLVDRAVVATVGVVAQLVELGELDPGVLDELHLDDPQGHSGECGARETAQRLNDWVDGLAPRLSPAHHNLVVAVRNGFLNQQDVVTICN